MRYRIRNLSGYDRITKILSGYSIQTKIDRRHRTKPTRATKHSVRTGDETCSFFFFFFTDSEYTFLYKRRFFRRPVSPSRTPRSKTHKTRRAARVQQLCFTLSAQTSAANDGMTKFGRFRAVLGTFSRNRLFAVRRRTVLQTTNARKRPGAVSRNSRHFFFFSFFFFRSVSVARLRRDEFTARKQNNTRAEFPGNE